MTTTQWVCWTIAVVAAIIINLKYNFSVLESAALGFGFALVGILVGAALR